MTILTVTAKGQITLRKDLLKHLGVRPGDKINAELRPGGRLEVAAAKPKGKISDIFDFLARPDGPELSIEDIKTITEEAWAGRR
jgi:bifunctional DNA-binding transcriptional regulator/antitoxin component of YhaV-PrlF toxin-antitoxin module